MNFSNVERQTIDTFIPEELQQAGPRLSPSINHNTQELEFRPK
ncbi:hypothetical protein [Zooshikella ganghwensis]|nr:hypothetical protein [Zooshikella ganghwensis]